MTTALYNHLQQALGEKKSVAIGISEIEVLGGEDWLLEVAAHAEELKLQVMPHPKDLSLILIQREESDSPN